MPSKPIVAVTMGDPAGIGPEIILKALADPIVKRVSRPLILGDWGVLQRTRSGKRGMPRLVCWKQGEQLLPLLENTKAYPRSVPRSHGREFHPKPEVGAFIATFG